MWVTNTWNCKRKLNLITSHYLAQLWRYEYILSVRLDPSNTRDVSCFPILSIILIITSSSCSTPSKFSFFNFWQLFAIKRSVSALKSCWKENISFTLTKRVLIVVLITRHYIYNCIKLMSNNEVFYTHFSFCFIFTTEQSTYVSRNTEVQLCSLCCSRRAISITRAKNVFIALGIQYAMRALHILICNLSNSTMFSHQLINGMI